MSDWIKFLDAAYYGSVFTFNAVLAHESAEEFAYYVGGNIALHPWFASDVRLLRQGGRHGMGIHVTTVLGRDGAADGAYFAQWNRNAYEAEDGDLFALDLEPGIYRGAPGQSRVYAAGWAKTVRDAGLRPVLYCTPDGCAALGEMFDAIWVAKPGWGNPATIFNPSFMPGWIAVQWAFDASFLGVGYDINTAEYLFISEGPGRGGEGPPPAIEEEEEMNPIKLVRQGGESDVFLVIYGGHMRHLHLSVTGELLHNDPVPGEWSVVLLEDGTAWNADETELRVRAVERAPGGRVYDSVWTTQTGEFSLPIPVL